jgi:hypothetical protein
MSKKSQTRRERPLLANTKGRRHSGQSWHQIRVKIETNLHHQRLSMFKNLLGPKIQQSLNPSISKYKKYRRIGKDLVHKIIECYVDDKALTYVTKLMGIKHGREIYIESEEEMIFVMDFLLHEYRVQGKTPLERYREDEKNLSKEEAEIIEARLSAYSSLFEISASDPRVATVTLIDQLNEGQVVTILDLNMSRTAKPGLLVFTRIIPFGDINTTSGIFALFPETARNTVLQKYKIFKKRVKSDLESIQTFIAFFKLNRTEGLEARTVDI